MHASKGEGSGGDAEGEEEEQEGAEDDEEDGEGKEDKHGGRGSGSWAEGESAVVENKRFGVVVSWQRLPRGLLGFGRCNYLLQEERS